MHDAEFNRLKEAASRRPLDAAEQEAVQARLAAHPTSRAEWEQDRALDGFLARLPDKPVPTNFTRLVLEATEPARRARSWGAVLRWRIFHPGPVARFAGLAGLALAAVFTVHQYRTAHRAEVASSVANLTRGLDLASGAAEMPAIEVLTDFDAIRRLGQPLPEPDEDLLAALQ